MDFSSGEFWKRRKSWFPVTIPFGPRQQKFNIEMKIYHWPLAAFSDLKMDNYQLED